MKLTRIEISGFKSFADTADLPFDDGVTAIVGPNGCGKSNVSDAVRWVLGEQRARLLRGAKMEDVIFHGAVKHRPVNVAEVSLVFDNSDDALPIAYKEVVITRRLSRSGQSDYLINQSPVRLRDIQDLLRGTGLGSDAGVVIEAQMIDRLLSDRADERRSLFEEAAGIGLYRDRKTSTERQLERTGEDLQRLEDVINEVQREVRSLARQRGRAERHRTLTAERFGMVMTLARREIGQFEERDAALTAGHADLSARLPELRTAVDDAERAREGRGQERASAEARRTELERRLSAARVEAGRLEGDVNLATERLQHATARSARAQFEREQAEARAAQARRDRNAAAQERQAASQARESVQTELDLRTATESETRSRLLTARDAVREAEDALQRAAEQHRALLGERSAVERDLSDLTAQRTEAETRRQRVAAERDAAMIQVEESRSRAERALAEERGAHAERERARHELVACREHEVAQRAALRAAEEALARLTTRREALEGLERDRVGLAPAARRLLEARGEFDPDMILGPLSDFLTTSRDEAAAVERVFGEWLHAVVVRDEAVSAISAWHARERPGPLVLLPAGGPVVGSDAAATLPVEAREPAVAWARVLLAGHDLLKPDGTAFRRPNGAVVLAGGHDGAGPLARRADLAELGAQMDETERTLTGARAAADEAARTHAEAERTLARATEAAERMAASLREAQGALDESIRAMNRVERELVEVQDDLNRLDERLTERSGRMEGIAVTMADLERSRTTFEETLRTRRTQLGELEAAQETARERRVHWQVEEAQVSAREQAAAEREDRAQQALAEAERHIAELDLELRAAEHDTDQVTAQRQQWLDQLAERKVAVQELEAAAASAETGVREAENMLAQAERAVEQARQALEGTSQQLHEVELERTTLTGSRQVLRERVEAEWHRPLEELVAEAPEVDGDAGFLREEAQRLAAAIEALGPVNQLAVEEHAEESRRLEFLMSQRDDLIAAKNRLADALREIDQTARAMFVESFESIRGHFRSVFQTLFEGGECDVRLADPSDPLSSDIDIHAAPRGKRTQRIHLLSSGERALVAVSLLFAIYLTKPAPFCLMDEVDAPLDDANVVRFVRLLEEFKRSTQFIVITHNPRTMQVADAVYGITMQEPGVSTIVGVRLGQVGAI